MTGLVTVREQELSPAPSAAVRSGRSGRRPPRTLALAAAIVAGAALVPLVYLFIRASDHGLSEALDVATGPRTLELLRNSAVLAGLVTATCIAIAVPLAWLTVRTDLPGRRAWTVLTALPLVVPSYIAAYALIGSTGSTGVLTDWLGFLGVNEVPRIDGLAGAWLVLSAVSYPYVLLPVRAAMAGLDPTLEEASRALGRGPRETFLRVTLPQLRPAVGAGALLVALYTLSDFGAVSLVRYDTFTRAVFLQYRSSFDRTPAAVLSLVLVALCAVVLLTEHRTRGRGAYYSAHGGRPAASRHTPLGRARWPAAGFCAAVTGATLFGPLVVVGVWIKRGLDAGEPIRVAWEAAGHSIQASLLAAVVITVVAGPVAYLVARYPGRLAAAIESGSFLGHVLPGVVVALSLVFFGARLVPALYQTRTLLTFAYVVLFLPLAVGALRSSILQVSPSLEEASRSLGENWWGTTRRVVAPLVRPGAAASFALVFLTAMKELPATLLLAPTGFSTLATEIWSSSSEGFFARAAFPAMMLVVLSSVPLAFIVARDARTHQRVRQGPWETPPEA